MQPPARGASSATLSSMNSASCPSAVQTSTHSPQPLQCAGVDEDAEGATVEAALGGHVAVLLRVGEVRAGGLRGEGRLLRRGGERRDPALQLRRRHDRAQDRGVGTGVDAGHAADALLREQLRDARGEVAEVARRGGAPAG